MSEIERLVASFKDYIESHNETFDTSESKVINGLRDALDIVIRGDSDDKSLLIAEHEDIIEHTLVLCGGWKLSTSHFIWWKILCLVV